MEIGIGGDVARQHLPTVPLGFEGRLLGAYLAVGAKVRKESGRGSLAAVLVPAQATLTSAGRSCRMSVSGQCPCRPPAYGQKTLCRVPE